MEDRRYDQAADTGQCGLDPSQPAVGAAGDPDEVNNSPDNLAANFKLYRNLDALYDVFGSVVESAGAFGSKDEFQSLNNDMNGLESARRSMGERMQKLAGRKRRRVDASARTSKDAERSTAASAKEDYCGRHGAGKETGPEEEGNETENSREATSENNKSLTSITPAHRGRAMPGEFTARLLQ